MSATSSLIGTSIDQFNRSGFAIIEGALSDERVAGLIEVTRTYASGARNGTSDLFRKPCPGMPSPRMS